MDQAEIREIMDACGDTICREYCPWADMDHAPGSLCEGKFCEEAVEAFLDDNMALMDDGYEI